MKLYDVFVACLIVFLVGLALTLISLVLKWSSVVTEVFGIITFVAVLGILLYLAIQETFRGRI